MATHQTMSAHTRDATTLPVIAGIVSGPVFLGSSILQGFTRNGFDLTQQPISFLCLGPLGLIERMTFVVAGLLVGMFAFRVAQTERRRWESVFFSLIGLGLLVAGAFPPDPGFGYPPGTADGPPDTITYHSTMHGLGFTISFIGFFLVCVANFRSTYRRRAWMRAGYTGCSAILALALGLAPGTRNLAARDLIAAVILWTWITTRALPSFRLDEA